MTLYPLHRCFYIVLSSLCAVAQGEVLEWLYEIIGAGQGNGDSPKNEERNSPVAVEQLVGVYG